MALEGGGFSLCFSFHSLTWVIVWAWIWVGLDWALWYCKDGTFCLEPCVEIQCILAYLIG